MMEHRSVSRILNAIYQVFPEEVSIAIADPIKFIYYQPGQNIDLRIKPGDSIKEGSATHKALTVRDRVLHHVDKEVYGVPYVGMSVPLLREGRPEGCVTVIFPEEVRRDPGKNRLRPHFLVGKAEDRWIPIPYQQICFIEASSGKTLLHTETGVYANKYSLTELEHMLPPDQFVRCHRSFIVNVAEIAEIHPDFHSTFTLILKGRNKVPVSQGYARSFRRLLGF